MDRRETLRRAGGGLAVLTTVGLAGCSGDDNGDEDDDAGGGDDGGSSDDSVNTEEDSSSDDSADEDTTDDTDDETPTQVENCPREDVSGATFSGEFEGSVVSNAIDGIEVESIDASIVTSEEAGDQLELAITVSNSGDQTTHPRDYTYDLTVYDDTCTVLEIPGVTQYGVSPDLEPGDTGSLFITPTRSEFSVDQIAAYEVTVSCSGPFAEGVYCPEE
jgi:hypothetical protein